MHSIDRAIVATPISIDRVTIVAFLTPRRVENTIATDIADAAGTQLTILHWMAICRMTSVHR